MYLFKHETRLLRSCFSRPHHDSAFMTRESGEALSKGLVAIPTPDPNSLLFPRAVLVSREFKGVVLFLMLYAVGNTVTDYWLHHIGLLYLACTLVVHLIPVLFILHMKRGELVGLSYDAGDLKEVHVLRPQRILNDSDGIEGGEWYLSYRVIR